MAKTSNYKHNLYQGGYSSLDPNKGISSEYRVSAGTIGTGTDARTANVAQEIGSKISTGTKNIELARQFGQVWEVTPDDQLDEVRRITKLTGTDISLHAPVQRDPSGFDGQQGTFSETQRKSVERQMVDTLNRASKLKDNSAVSVVFHAAEGIPAYYPEKTEKGEKMAMAINREDKKIGMVPLEGKKWPGMENPDIKSSLDQHNLQSWISGKQELAFTLERAESFLSESDRALAHLGNTEGQRRRNAGAAHLDESYRRLQQMFELAYKYGNEKNKKILDEYKNKITPMVSKLDEQNVNQEEVIKNKKEIVEKGLEVLGKIKEAPQVYQPLDNYVNKKAVDTFGNVAYKNYKNFKSKKNKVAPQINIENSYGGGAISTGSELKEIVEKSRENFAKKLIEKEGMSKEKAKNEAKKMIGATWDTGRINVLRKHGFTEKEIIKESEKIAPYVKHVHLSDNFGTEAPAETAPGAGNAPIKEIMKKLKDKGFKGNAVVEAMNWWEHFKEPPMKETYQALGSPVYSMEMGPYWSQTEGHMQNYSGGYGLMLPATNYESLGAGFSQLPMELGGQKPGANGSRMSGRPME